MARRGSVLIGAVVGALATMLLGGIAWAAIPNTPGGVIQGCYDSGGNVKVIEALPCPPKYTPFQWNQQGPSGTNGTNGTSVTSASEPAGANCTDGGSKFTASNGVTYACNGAAGLPGSGSLAGYEQAVVTGPALSPGSHEAVAAACPAGKKVLGGGWGPTAGGVRDWQIFQSAPNGDTVWLVDAKNIADVDGSIKVYAVCAS